MNEASCKTQSSDYLSLLSLNKRGKQWCLHEQQSVPGPEKFCEILNKCNFYGQHTIFWPDILPLLSRTLWESLEHIVWQLMVRNP